jgi:MtrB/PioB family decaheme-associated outer membrane protein
MEIVTEAPWRGLLPRRSKQEIFKGRLLLAVGGIEMKVRSKVLKARTAALLTGTMALMVGSASGVWAADMNAIVKAPAPAADQGWYFTGDFEAGGRFYVERPPSGFGRDKSGNFLLPKQTDSIAKFEEYGKIPNGLFLDSFYLEMGSKDGRYNIDAWGKDVGVNAQSYGVDFAQNGFQYLTLGWDQTPHLISTSAKSLFSGVGSTTLTVPNSVQDLLKAQYGNATSSATSGVGNTARNAINNIVDTYATHIDEIGTRRDKFSVEYRITPTTDWDFKVGYSHEDRTGTKPGTLDYTSPSGFPSNVIAVPVPVDETTHKPWGSGEYVGSGPWGRYSVQLGYEGSIYNDNLTKLTADNPFSNTGAQSNYGTLMVGLPPSNEAHSFSASAATDVPFFKSRFTTTNEYSRRTQDAAFLNQSNNGLTADPLPASSLDGKVNTFVTNNVLTSKLTDSLSNKLRFRYYDYDNQTPEYTFTNVVFADSEISAGPFTTEPESYKKTNVDEDLRWATPLKWLTLGAGYGFERWDRTNRFTTITNEHTGKVFADVKLTHSSTAHLSYSYSSRRYDGDYEIDDGAWLNSRMFDLANRNRQRAKLVVDYDMNDMITISPSAGLRWDDYPETTPFQTGLSSEHSWNAGIEVGIRPTSTLRFTAGYTYEQSKLDMTAIVADADGSAVNSNGTANNQCLLPGYSFTTPYTAPMTCGWSDNMTTKYHTFVGSANWQAIPGKLDFRLNYVASWAREAHDFKPCSLSTSTAYNCNGISVSTSGVTGSQVGLPWPDNTSLYQRLDATARYYFDKEFVEKLGWKGQVMFKLRYTWEHNDGSYWQSDSVNAYFGTLTGNTELTGTGRSLWLAYNNPNYTAQLIAASLKFKW